MRGYVTAPETGDYTFAIAGDDSGELWLSSSASPFSKTRIACFESYTGLREWTKFPTQTSQAIHLEAGQKVYIEALQKEGSGGDHVSIGWQTPGATEVSLIPASALATYGLNSNDVDDDFLPDDWEESHGLSSVVNDASADPDQDGMSNLEEYRRGTDPQVGNLIIGGLLQEIWRGIPGKSVPDLTHASRFLAAPDAVEFLPDFESRKNLGDNYGKRVRGYLTAPETGAYTFWISSNDASTFYLSASESKFGGEVIGFVGEDVGFRGWDTYTSQKSKPVDLVAGQRYYFEVLQKEATGDDHLSVAWQKPGGVREIIPGEVVSGYVPTAEDQDDDGLPDDWEIAHGLSPADNGSIDPKNGAFGDFDGDGLDNSTEKAAGTRVDLADTDGDGLSDYDETLLYGTQPLSAESVSFQTVATIPGGSFTASSGTWQSIDEKANQTGVRGWVEYSVDLPNAGVHQVNVDFTPQTDVESSPDYEIVFSMDGKRIRRETVTVAAGNSGKARILTPWLVAGAHTVRVFVDNSYQYRRVSLNQVEVQAARGADADGNGIADWVDARLTRLNSLEAPAFSYTSPACLEGKTFWPELSTVAGQTVQAAPDDRWFANVPLNPSGSTTIESSLENGGRTPTAEVEWKPVNILQVSDLTIRAGDSLKLTAFFGNEPTAAEAVNLEVEGQSFNIQADQPVVHTFATPGIYPVRVTHQEGANIATATLNVRVAGAAPIDSPVSVVGFFREMTIPPLEEGVSLQLDSRMEVRGMTDDTEGGKKYDYRLNSLEERTLVTRLGGSNGPILQALPLRVTRIRMGSQTGAIIQDNSTEELSYVKMAVIVDNLYPEVKVECKIVIGGVIFDDGSLVKILTLPEDFSASGEGELNFIKSGNAGSNCHKTWIWHADQKIAYLD
ncbi:MAG: PA14 domain-containing protein [Luteolibacter sp.]